jgi:hypothetical protein
LGTQRQFQPILGISVAFEAGRTYFLRQSNAEGGESYSPDDCSTGKGHSMKFFRGGRAFFFAGALLFVALLATAQDADKQKLIDIEKAFAAQSTPGPESAAVSKQYLLDTTLIQLTGQGQIGTLSKTRILELSAKPNPADPNVKSATSVSDFQIEFYGDTALVGYKMTNTDSGHKDAALNTTDHYGCLDTFVKRNAQWLLVANACTPSEPLPQAEWNAAKKAMAQQPKDVKDAYH